MDNHYLILVGFISYVAIIVYSGTKLARYGDKIAELTGWGKAWVGLILVASVTSLPELMTGIGSVTLVDEPDLAAGNVFGSCVFNLLILSLIDVLIKKPITSLVKISHLYAGLFGIILIAFSGLAIMLSDVLPVWFWISPFSILLILVYISSVWGIFHYTQSETEKESKRDDAVDEVKKKSEISKVAIAYTANAVLVIGAALLLPYFGEHLAQQSGLSETFFGTLFLAAATSLPELVVSIAAIRIGAFDLFVGNLFGSNVFNIFILALTDFFYTRGSLFANVKVAHLDSVIVVIIMTAVTGLGFMAKPQKKLWRLSVDTFIILILYIGLMVALYFKT
jgi:cation:H+ antiporter